MAKRKSQNARVLKRLEAGRRITPLYAIHVMGITRLSARIYDLHKLGYETQVKMVTVINRFHEQCHVAEYWLARCPCGAKNKG